MGTVQAEQHAVGTAEHDLLNDKAPLGLRDRFLPVRGHFCFQQAFVVFKGQNLILGQALKTVDYTKVIEQAYADGARIFLEMGPGNSCSRMIGSILDGRPHMARAACYPGQKPTSLILRLLAHCLAERVPVNLSALYPDSLEIAEEPVGPRIETMIGGKAFVLPALPKQKLKNEKPGRGTRDAKHQPPAAGVKPPASRQPL